MIVCKSCHEKFPDGSQYCPTCGKTVPSQPPPTAWPQPSEFRDAVQNPALSFIDPDLRDAKVECGADALPIPAAGNFGVVFQMLSPQGKRWALKCFTSAMPGRQERYRKISAHLRDARLPFTVGFDYLEQGVYIREQWYPVLKMDWVEGLTLNRFVGKRCDKPALLKALTEMWVKLALLLREKQVTHADLQHGNVMLIPGKTEGRVALRLVDYDGMYLPSLAGTNSGELGHPTYQHPRRLAHGYYGPEVDRFSHLVIYTALRAVMVRGRSIWQSYNNDDNLLFTQADFKEPRQSKVLRELWQQGPDDLRALAGRLALATEQSFDQLPLLDEVVDESNNVLPLTAQQVRDAEAILIGRNLSGPVSDDEVQVTAWYRRNAELGDAEAQFSLGWRVETGLGVPMDETEAVAWYRKAALQGNVDAQYNLAVMYAEGRGVANDDAQAVKWYRKAADQRDADAQGNLGYMFEHGRGVPKNDAEAVAWYRKAAQQGNARAQVNLGLMYDDGHGVTEDDVQAASWYRKAAEQGYADAQHNLAMMYAEGTGVSQDDAQAVAWSHKAADQGHADGQCNLGYMYECGRGVPKNDAQAEAWYRKAAEQGHAIAKSNLELLLDRREDPIDLDGLLLEQLPSKRAASSGAEIIGTVTNEFGDAFYGDEKSFNSSCYYGRVFKNAKLLLVDPITAKNDFGFDVVKIKVLSNQTGYVGKIGWVGLDVTNFKKTGSRITGVKS